jgi:hypothetical protein
MYRYLYELSSVHSNNNKDCRTYSDLRYTLPYYDGNVLVDASATNGSTLLLSRVFVYNVKPSSGLPEEQDSSLSSIGSVWLPLWTELELGLLAVRLEVNRSDDECSISSGMLLLVS